MLDFWATWCGPCVAELPHLKKAFEEFGQRPQFAMLSVSLDYNKNDPVEFVRKNEMKWTQAFAGEWARTDLPARYGVMGIPAAFLIGPDGTIVAQGMRGEQLVAAIEKALK